VMESGLKGLPQEQLAHLPIAKDKNGTRIIPLHEKTVVGPVMKFVQDAETRKSIDFALGNQNKASNVPLIE